MSKSSNAFFSSVVEVSMRNAAAILFWIALMLFILTIASYSTILFRDAVDQTDTPTRVHTILDVLVIALNNAVWPFVGASVVWTLQNRSKEAAQ